MFVSSFRRFAVLGTVAMGLTLAGGSICWSEEAEAAPAADAVDRTYFARDAMPVDELSDWIERMQNKPASIRARPGFVAALLDATQRILNAQPADALRNAAILTRFEVLHFAAISGDAKADEALFDLAEQEKDNAHAQVAHEAIFHLLEQRADEADKLSQEDLTKLLEELQAFFAAEAPTDRQLRLASRTVKAANMLADISVRNKYFDGLGPILAKSGDKKMARYGKQVAKASRESDLVGQPLELEGVAFDGAPFDWARYRGKVVLVVFWATWCGPCRAEMPNVVQNYEKYKDRGFEVVGISLDKDREALQKFLGENPLPWVTLFHDGGDNPLAEKYGVQAIPAEFLVDATGKVIAEEVRGPALGERLEKLLAK